MPYLLLLILACCSLLPATTGAVVISEFMASNMLTLRDEDGESPDWLELYNPDTNSVSLLNWSLTDNPGDLNQWRFPATNLPPSGYLVVFASKKDRRTPGQPLHTNFKLAASGGFLAVVRPDGTVEHAFTDYPEQATDVSYGLGQAYGSFKLLTQGAAARGRVATNSADYTTNMAGWKTNAALDERTWRGFNTGAGYDTEYSYGSLIGANGNFQTAMLNSNASLCFRAKFTVTNITGITSFRLRMKYDDGFAAWLNGKLVASNHCPASLGWNSAATFARDDNENDYWQVYYLDSALPYLQEGGTNLLALQGLNVSSGDADMLLLPELETIRGDGALTGEMVYFTAPTPGALNTSGSTNLGPLVSDVTRDPPERPTGSISSPALKVTARVVRSLREVASVRLYYRLMFNSEVSIMMRDDGVAPDSVAGDSIYSGNVPTAMVGPGQMVRWRVVATDVAGNALSAPRYFDPYDSEQYYGTVALKADPVSNLPVLHCFLTSMASADTRGGTRCSFFYQGRFYDNAGISLHGQSTTGGSFKKKSHNVDFPRDNRFAWRPEEEPVKDIKLLSNYGDKSKVRNTLAYDTYSRSGSAYCLTFPVRMHTNGAFYGIVDLMEDTDDRYLARQGFDPEGALYKIYNDLSSTGSAEKKTRLYENSADLQALITNLDTNHPLDLRRTYAYDNVNLPGTVNYLASHAVPQNQDHGHKNFLMYRDTRGTGEWQPMPWDVDLTFGHLWSGTYNYFWNEIICTNRLQAGNLNRLYRLVFDSPELNSMFTRRVRTLMDKLLKPPGTPAAGLLLENEVNDWMVLLDPTATHTPAGSDADADFAAWGSWPTNNPGTCRDECARITGLFLPGRRAFLYDTNPVTRPMSGTLPIPEAQPTNFVLGIEQVDYNPVSHNQLEEFFIIRNTNGFAVDLTDWHVSGAVDFTFAPGTVIPAGGGTIENIGLLHVARNPAAFRARTNGPSGGQKRLVTGPYSGELSARGETLKLQDTAGRVLASLTYTGAPSLAQQFLRITELMYNPDPVGNDYTGAQECEYLELKNISTNVSLNLQGVHFENGLTFAFSNVTWVAPQGTLVLAKNPSAFAARYGSGIAVLGPYEGYLDNSGERITLLDSVNEEVLDFSYNDSWYPVTDGLGFSLVVVDEQAEPDAWADKHQWRASGEYRGSPGRADPMAQYAPVLVNEVLAHTDLPQVDSVELYNPTTNIVELGGWWLTDDFYTPKKYRFAPGTSIGPGAFMVVDEHAFNSDPAASNSFRFSSTGDDVWLFAGDSQTNLTGYYHGFYFGATPNGLTLGRHVTGAGAEHFVAQRTNTLGTNNSGPLVGPLVVSGVMYHPPDLLSNEVVYNDFENEFIELRNITGTNVPLFDPSHPTNTWRLSEAVEYLFPTNTFLTAGGRLLVVGFAPTNASRLATFKNKWALGDDLVVFGPWSGKLDNDSDDIQLERPDNPNADGSVPYVLVDRVRYMDGPPWPLGADGTGAALWRCELAEYGDDPVNWRAAAPRGSAAPDTDKDGMPDWWEIVHGLNPDLNDANEDPDGDGFSNGQEWLARLDPHDAGSVLRLAVSCDGWNAVRLSFSAMADVAYTLQQAESVDAASWSVCQQIAAAETNRTVVLINPCPGQGRFYRLVTPPVP